MERRRDVIALLDGEWTALSELGPSLTDEQWARPTDLPGWSVKDNLSHVIGTERMLLGLPVAEHDLEMPEWVKNTLGRFNEIEVDSRRHLSAHEVLAEFLTIADRRRQQLDAMTDEDWSRPTASPAGEIPYGEFMEMRLFDTWIHEQDMRRAAGSPSHLEGPIPAFCFDYISESLLVVVGKRAKAPEGSAVAFDVSGPAARRLVVAVRDAWARWAQDASADATLTMEFETYVCLLTGRRSGPEALASGAVVLDGDRALGERVLAGINVLF
jgi:uncharacterized protein (TIGR03083 family)